MGKPDHESDKPTPYRLSRDPPPGRRYRPMPGVRASSDREPDDFDRPALRRLFGTDPFPWALALGVLIWIGLGLGARVTPVCALLLGLAGLAVIVLSQVWLYLSIFMDDVEAGIWSLISGWYRVFYLYSNPELAWRPAMLGGVGVLMLLTGAGIGIGHLHNR